MTWFIINQLYGLSRQKSLIPMPWCQLMSIQMSIDVNWCQFIWFDINWHLIWHHLTSIDIWIDISLLIHRFGSHWGPKCKSCKLATRSALAACLSGLYPLRYRILKTFWRTFALSWKFHFKIAPEGYLDMSDDQKKISSGCEIVWSYQVSIFVAIS